MTGGFFSSGSVSYNKTGVEQGEVVSEANFNNNSTGISNLKITFDNTAGISASVFNLHYGNSNDASSWSLFDPSNFIVYVSSTKDVYLSWDEPILNGWLEVKYGASQYLYFGNLIGDVNFDRFLTASDALSIISHLNSGGPYSYE